MTNHRNPSAVRRVAAPRLAPRLVRAAAVAPALVVLCAGTPALAAPPEQWPPTEPVSPLFVLLLLGGLPLLLIAVISFLVYVPAMARGGKYTPGLAWHNEIEWFGGPTGGVEALNSAGPQALEGGDRDAVESRGGASARW